jgi:dipeptidyl aminopeptidase/acylaminoacyl peptidase
MNRSCTQVGWVVSIFFLASLATAEPPPANAIDAIRAPILLAHAMDDTVVPFGQTKNFAKLLGAKRKDYKLIKLSGEDHWLSTSSSRLTILQAVEESLAANLR